MYRRCAKAKDNVDFLWLEVMPRKKSCVYIISYIFLQLQSRKKDFYMIYEHILFNLFLFKLIEKKKVDFPLVSCLIEILKLTLSGEN